MMKGVKVMTLCPGPSCVYCQGGASTHHGRGGAIIQVASFAHSRTITCITIVHSNHLSYTRYSSITAQQCQDSGIFGILN